MSFDTSRYIFDPRKNYAGVIMEQGRVQLDSDWNDWLAQLSRRIQAGTLDAMGRVAYPTTTPYAFLIAFDAGGKLTIGPGRMYVDGLLAENHGDPATATWDSSLAELSGSPQPPPAKEAGAIFFVDQPWFTGDAPPSKGTFLAYLDVRTRAVTYLEDPKLIDPAVGIETTGRLQTIWQVKLVSMNAGFTCATAGSPWPAASGGLLTTAPIANTPSGPCCLTTNTGYTGLENQHYRVEIHTTGPIGKATFKWSRDNASVETGVTSIVGVTNSVGVKASQLGVFSLGRDQVLGFRPGDWIELLDDTLELAGLPGELHLIDTIDFSAKIITLDALCSTTNFPVDATNQTKLSRHTRIRRWDQSGKVFASDGTTLVTDLGLAGSTGDILIPAAGTAVILENGVTVAFNVSSATGSFNTGDFWTFAARTADGSIDLLTSAPPRGIHHHYTGLSVVNFDAGTATDCRPPVATSDDAPCGCCCTVTVGDGVESFGKYTSINDAINALPDAGGEVCILPGRYFEHVFLEDRHDVVIHGCGYQTRLASPSLAPPAPPPPPAAAPAGPALGVANFNPPPAPAPAAAAAAAAAPIPGIFAAVITIANCAHIQLRDFAVEADTDEVGILIDGTGKLVVQASDVFQNANGNPNSGAQVRAFVANRTGATDITVQDLFLTASTLPAVLAKQVRLLRIDANRVAMKDVASLWPAIWVSGQEMHLDQNFVGIRSAASLREWFPTSVTADLAFDAAAAKAASAAKPADAAAPTTGTKPASATLSAAERKAQVLTFAREFDAQVLALSVSVSGTPLHPGGIQIGGPSRGVFVKENIIVGGRGNGITLGSLDVLDANGGVTGFTKGVFVVQEEPCSSTGTLHPPTRVPGRTGGTIVAGGPLLDIHIDHNRIAGMGLCGIGPVALFDLSKTLEIISIGEVTITSNTIANVLLRGTPTGSAFGTTSSAASSAGAASDPASAAGANATSVSPISTGSSNTYGAITLAMAENVVIRDNAITNFGARPGDQASGIFILVGEMIEISRNQILETRDLAPSSAGEANPGSSGLHGGIIIAIVTPLSVSSSFALASFSKALYVPGLPALRVEENVVRIPLGIALVAIGFGPFAISDNHFTCGGSVPGGGRPTAQTVLIMNVGTAVDAVAAGHFGGLKDASGAALYGVATPPPTTSFFAASNGTVLFTNNICQFEARADRQRSITSVAIFSADHLTFSNNQVWFDADRIDAIVDALLAAGTILVTGNRFQESATSVFLSAITVGAFNITTQNISTFCLLVEGTKKVGSPNIALVDSILPDLCAELQKQ